MHRSTKETDLPSFPLETWVGNAATYQWGFQLPCHAMHAYTYSTQLLPILFAKTFGCQIAKGGRIFLSIKRAHRYTRTLPQWGKIGETSCELWVMDILWRKEIVCLPCRTLFPYITSHDVDAWSFILRYIILNPPTENAPQGAPFDAQTDKLGSKALDENSRSKEAQFPRNRLEYSQEAQ